jgi:hypothetical protein
MNLEAKIKSLLKYSLKRFKNIDEHFLFGLKEIEKHLPELRELHAKRDPHKKAEIADLYIWAKMLLMASQVDENVIHKRIKRFREKIKESRNSVI